MTRAALSLMALALAACPIVDDAGLPGSPCDGDRDCGAGLACIDVDGAGETVCIPDGSSDDDNDDPPVGCAGKADGDACSDGDPCTEDDACSEGVCEGDVIQCGQQQACSGGVCIDLGECSLPGAVERVTNTPGVSGSVALAYDAERNQLAAVYDDDVTAISEIYFQLLDADSGAPVGAAVQLTDGRPANQDDFEHPSFQPSIVYAPEQDEFGVSWTTFGGGILGLNSNAFSGTVTASGVPASSHDVVTGLAISIGPAVIAWTGAGYGIAWVDDRNSDSQVSNFSVFFAPLEDDASLASFSNKQVSPGDDVDGDIALAFNPRTTSFATAYRVEGAPGALVVTFTNVDGEAPQDFVVSDGGEPFDPALAVTSTGYTVAWKDDPDGDGLGELFVRGLDDGGRVGAPARPVTPGEDCGRPSIVDVPGGVALAYAASNGGVLEVRLRILFDDGTIGPFRTLGAGQRPSTAALPTGVALGWQQVTGDEADIFASAQCVVP